MAKYVLKLTKDENKVIEAGSMERLLYLACYEYCDYYTLHDAGDISDMLNWDNGDDKAFTGRIHRAIRTLKQGYHVVFGDKTAKFKPNELKTISDVERVMKRAGACGFTIEEII